MSKSVNEVLIIGNCGKEPEIKILDNGVKVASFSVATSTGGYKKQDGTEIPEKTSWHNIVVWRGLADIAEKYVHKGDKVVIKGQISYREYENDKGEKRYVTDIIAYDLVLCGKAENNGSKPAIIANDMPQDAPPMPPTDDLPF